MTAIFAYVTPHIAFVAGDSLRAYPAWGPVRAQKVHGWSDGVLLAQCGDGVQLTRMIAEARAQQPMLPYLYPGLAPDAQLLVHFAALQPKFYAAAVAATQHYASGAAHISGTILVASVADSFGPERIHRFDFVTGKSSQGSTLEADGTDAPAFRAYAQQRLAARLQARGLLQLDAWAHDCIAYAVAAYPKNVGWPADVLIARPFTNGRLVGQQALQANTPLERSALFTL